MRKSFHQTLSILAICLLLAQTIFGSLPVFAQTTSDTLNITMTENGQPYTEGSIAISPVTIQVVTTSPDSAGIELSQDLGATWKPYDTAEPLVLADAGDHDVWFRLTDSDGQAVIEKRHIQITTAALFSTPSIIYVNENSPATNGDGTSWDNAYKDLQAALSAAVAGQEIWIAKGTYKPTSGTDRTISFQMKNGVKIYGGFVGDERTATDRDKRDFEKNKTILSGDIGTDGVNTDNAYHVFYHPDTLILNHTAILDGVTITGGNANGSSPHDTGGGMYNSSSGPTVTNVEFRGNEADAGGGMSNRRNSSPTITNVEFSGNKVTNSGGGMFNERSSPNVSNVEFSGNEAAYGGGIANRNNSSPTVTNVEFRGNEATYGGGMSNRNNSSPTVTNVVFRENTATTDGGGMYNHISSPTLTNVTMSGNTTNSTDEAAIYNSVSVPTIQNSIIVGNNGLAYNGTATIKNSLIGDDQKGQLYDNLGNPVGQEYQISDIFIDPAKKDYRLKAGSSAIDKGDSTYPELATITKDLDGNERKIGMEIDLGAYEYQVSVPNHTVIFNSNGGSTVAQQTVRENTLISEPTPPTRAGYTFAGWYRDSGFTNAWDFTKDVVTANVTLYANWDATQVGTIIYVNEKSPAANGGDGTSWATAYKALQAALTAAGTGQEIWIAEGTYKPTKLSNSTNSRTASFQMKNGVKIYGGFVGNETTAAERDARNFKTNKTILSGDIGIDGVNTDNAYNVFYHPADLFLNETAILDGVTITGGNANGNFPHNAGGGMSNDSSSPTVTNVEFSGNEAEFGGGMFNSNSSPTVTNVEFSGNEATYGGGMFNNVSSPTLINITMSGNTVKGPAIYNNNTASVPKIHNSIIVGNNGPAYNGTATIKNSLIGDSQKGQLYDSAEVSGGKDHQITDIFIDPTKKNYRLKAGSPAIDKGDNSYNNTQIDLDGKPRVHEGVIDLGAYEYQVSVPNHKVTYNGNGAMGGQAPPSATHEENTTVTVEGNTGNLVNPNHTFTGWNTKANGTGTAYAAGATFQMGKANVTLYAQWKANPTYTVTYNGNGATSGQVPPSATHEENTTVTVSGNTGNLVKSNHTFTGWNTEADGTGTAYAAGATFQMGKANVTLYAQWKANPTYTVIYNGNGATSGQVPPSASYEENATVTVQGNSGNLVKPNHTFTGWNTEANGKGTAYAAGATFQMGKANVTLYAQWKVNPPTPGGDTTPPPTSSNDSDNTYSPPTTVKITLHSNDGTIIEPINITYNTKVSDLPVPTRAGFRFEGWYEDEALTKRWADGTLVRENIALYAKWTALPAVEPEPETPQEPQPPMSPQPTVTFDDVEQHWAQEMIEELATLGIIQGFEDSTFRPNAPINRMHVAALLTRAFPFENVREGKAFSDVSPAHPYYDAILTLQQAGIIDGRNGAFLPKENMTRAELAKVLVGVLGFTPEGTASFSDVASTHWSTGYIAVLEREGIALGDNGKYSPNDPLTRAQFVAFLYRILQLQKQ